MNQNNNKYKDEMLYWAKRLYQKDLMPSTSGNISIRLNDNMLISASGVCSYDMEYDDIILTDFDGNVKEGHKNPSSEKLLHGEIYSTRNDINAIIHSHNPLITAFAVAGVPIKKPILPDFVFNYDEIPIIPYFCPSSIQLAEAVCRMFEDYNAVLMQNHGIVVGDIDLKSAFYKLELIKTYTETYFASEVLGGSKAMNKAQILEIKKLVRR